MSLKENESYFSQARVLPVLTPESVAGAVAVSRVLFEAGLRMQEITLRTEWALETITALAAKGDCPDLILLDLNMPRVNGFEVLRFLAAEHCCQATTVVVMTTSNAPRDQERSLELGAKACITKPPGFDDLLKVLSSFEPYLQPQLG